MTPDALEDDARTDDADTQKTRGTPPPNTGDDAAEVTSIRSSGSAKQNDSPVFHRRERTATVQFPHRPCLEQQQSFCRFGIDQPLSVDELPDLPKRAVLSHSCSCPGAMDKTIFTISGNPGCTTPGLSVAPSIVESRKASVISEDDLLKQRLIQKQFRNFFQPSKSRRQSLRAHEHLDLREWQQKQTARAQCRWMIHPLGKFRTCWEMVIVVVSIVNLLVIPMSVAYFRGFEPLSIIIVNILSDLIFVVDIALNFITGYVDKENVHSSVTMDPVKARNHYLRGWFAVDFISTFPADDFVLPFIRPDSADEYLTQNQVIHIAKFLALLRLLRIFRLVRYLTRCQEFFYSSSSWIYIRIFNLVLLMLLVAHWNACLQFLVGSYLNFPEDSWIARTNIQNKPWYEQWSWSLFNSFSQMFSIAHGRVTPDSLVDMWFTIVGMLTGASVYALILANVATMWREADMSRKLHRQKMREVEDYMSFRRFPRELRSRVRDYFEQRYCGHVFNEDNILESMSEPLRELVMLHNCQATIRMVPFFERMEPAFIKELVTKLRFDFFQPDDVIVSEGTIGTKMFFLQNGKVSVGNHENQVLTTLQDGSYFGELCLLLRCKRNATVRAKTHCSVFTLGYDDFHEVLSRFPVIRMAIEALANDILESRERSMSAILDYEETVASWSEFVARESRRVSKEELDNVEVK